jgi:tetratricopeptide (TPR) repeat protein
MADYDAAERYDELNPGRLAATGLAVVGGLLAVSAAGWAVARFVELSRAEQPPMSTFIAATTWLLAAWGFSVLLWALADLLRRQDELPAVLRDGLQRMIGATPRPGAVHPRGHDKQAELLEELVHLMRELRDIELLSEPERSARLQHEADELVRQLEHDIPALLREHKLREAKARLQHAQQRFPSIPNWDTLARQIEQTRERLESHDIAMAQREVEDLLALGAWDRAVEVVRNVRHRHPEAAAVETLAQRVAQARDQATSEERQRLMAEAQDATNRRDWIAATRMVETLLDKYPGTPESQQLREQMPTLRANAEVQVRQEMEAEIKGLITAHRYGEALRIARELIQKYPNSPQAAVLRDQLPRLEERAQAGA